MPVLRSFDHDRLARTVEYHGLRRAISMFADLCGRHNMTLGGLAQTVDDMVLAIRLEDSSVCSHRNWPYRLVRSGDDLTGWYQCVHCGRTWTCEWSFAYIFGAASR